MGITLQFSDYRPSFQFESFQTLHDLTNSQRKLSGDIQGHFSCAVAGVRVTKFRWGKIDKQTEGGGKKEEWEQRKEY